MEKPMLESYIYDMIWHDILHGLRVSINSVLMDLFVFCAGTSQPAHQSFVVMECAYLKPPVI